MQSRRPPERAPFPRTRLVVTPSTVLTAHFDLADRIRAATPSDTLKGMFFHRIAALAARVSVTAEVAGIQHRVREDRHLSFSDYPVADYFRWVAAVGRAMHPRHALSEGMRRVAAEDFDEFATSRVGSIALSFTGGARGTLAKSGMLYSQVLKGARVESEATADGAVIRYRNYPGPVEFYPIGTIESTCRHYDADYTIEVDVLGPDAADYFVRVTA